MGSPKLLGLSGVHVESDACLLILGAPGVSKLVVAVCLSLGIFSRRPSTTLNTAKCQRSHSDMERHLAPLYMFQACWNMLLQKTEPHVPMYQACYNSVETAQYKIVIAAITQSWTRKSCISLP